MKVYMAPMEGLTDYMFRNAYDKFFGHNKIDKYFMPFISPNKSEKFLAKEMSMQGSFAVKTRILFIN